MFPRRLAAPILLLVAALTFSLLATVSSAAAPSAKGKIVSAKLSKTSFTAPEAGTVTLKCKFSPASSRVAYLLQTYKSGKWAKLRSVVKKGKVKSRTIVVKQLFGSKPVTAGRYRVKISAGANSKTRSFTVTEPGLTVGPWAGSIGEAGVVEFEVSENRRAIEEFYFSYVLDSSDRDEGCSEITAEITVESLPLSNKSFSNPEEDETATFAGKFDSSTIAHGTFRQTGEDDCGEWDTGQVAWTARPATSETD